MIKHLLIICALLISTTLSALTLPTEVTISEQRMSLTTTFDIHSLEGKLGTVTRAPLSWTPKYSLKDTQKDLVALAKMTIANGNACFEIFDSQDNPLGSIENKPTWFTPTIEIFSPRGLKLARCKLNFWGTKYTVADIVDGHLLAIASRSFFRKTTRHIFLLKNKWTVNIIDKEAIEENFLHPKMLLMTMALLADRAYWEDFFFYHSLNQSMQDYHLSQMQTIAYKEPLHSSPQHTQNSVEPTEADFAFVEGLATEEITDEIEFLNTTERLSALLESNELTDGQKEALYLMLKNRLESPDIRFMLDRLSFSY